MHPRTHLPTYKDTNSHIYILTWTYNHTDRHRYVLLFLIDLVLLRSYIDKKDLDIDLYNL